MKKVDDTQPIKPKGKVIRSSAPKKGYLKIGEPQIEIAAWCRDDNAKLHPEQVHFIFHWPAQLADLPPLVMRFKGPDTLGFFIEELAKYRRMVWPECAPVTGESFKTSLSTNEFYRALAELVKLSSHYAELLNMYDGGERIVFKTPESWIERLRETGDLPHEPTP